MRTYVMTNPYGRMGNRIWAFAHVVAAAIEHDARVINLAFDEYAGYFQSTAGFQIAGFPKGLRQGHPNHVLCGKTRSIVRRAMRAKDDRREFDLTPNPFVGGRRTVIVNDWLSRSDTLVEKHASSLREFFQPVESISRNVDSIVSRARGAGLLVGVHVRHGDFATAFEGRYFHTWEEYFHSMSKMLDELGSDTRFLVCTDSDERPSTSLPVTWADGNEVEDLYALSKCDLLLGSAGSTFATWAAFMGGLELKYPVAISDTSQIHQ